MITARKRLSKLIGVVFTLSVLASACSSTTSRSISSEQAQTNPSDASAQASLTSIAVATTENLLTVTATIQPPAPTSTAIDAESSPITSTFPVTYGQPFSGTANIGRATAFVLTGQAGDVVQLQIDTSAPSNVSLSDPSGATAIHSLFRTSVALPAFVLPINGAYTVTVQPIEVDNTRFTVSFTRLPSTQIPTGEEIKVSLSQDTPFVVFPGEADQNVYITLRNADNSGLGFSLMIEPLSSVQAESTNAVGTQYGGGHLYESLKYSGPHLLRITKASTWGEFYVTIKPVTSEIEKYSAEGEAVLLAKYRHEADGYLGELKYSDQHPGAPDECSPPIPCRFTFVGHVGDSILVSVQNNSFGGISPDMALLSPTGGVVAALWA